MVARKCFSIFLFISIVSNKASVTVTDLMLSSTINLLDPDPVQAEEAEEAVRLMASLPDAKKTLLLKSADHEEVTVKLPEEALRIMHNVLMHMAAGEKLMLVPTHHELTTQEAADLLRVSRPYLVKLLEEGQIKYHNVGNRRKVRFDHLMTYREKMKKESREALDELTIQAQELGMGY
jgi:excisionase family DNA binding protein